MATSDLKTVRAILGVLVTEGRKAEAALAALEVELRKDDPTMAMAVASQVKALQLAAEEAEKLVERLQALQR